MASVTIGREFFAKAKNDYSNWMFAWVREAFQNAADSGATEIKISFSASGTDAVVAKIEDNGCGMTEDTLVNKLFSLGSSGKDFKSGAVGGFGKAKELLYFCQKDYLIHTNGLLVKGIGGQYEIESTTFVKGTTSYVTLDCQSLVEVWNRHAANVVEMSEFAGNIQLNGFRAVGRTRKGKLLKTFNCGKMYDSCGVRIGQIIFRVNGSPMFTNTIKGLKQGLVIELNTPCIEHLAANRDSLTYEARNEIEPFLTELAIDKNSALRKPVHTLTTFNGKKGKLRLKRAVFSSSTKMTIRSASPGFTILEYPLELSPVDFQKALVEYDFMIYHAKNEPLPQKWQVGTLCENAQWVAWAWSSAVWEVFISNAKKPNFGFGFVFEDGCNAKYNDGNFLLNPCHPDYKIKYTRTRKSSCEILALAVHEYVHHLGHSYHDEDYASAFTDVVSKVMFNQPHILTKMLDATAQSRLEYEDSKSRTAFLE